MFQKMERRVSMSSLEGSIWRNKKTGQEYIIMRADHAQVRMIQYPEKKYGEIRERKIVKISNLQQDYEFIPPSD